MEELISIIIPVYNVQNYLRRCLDSVVNQTYSNLEIILIDDGSQDNSSLICDEYADKDDRIQVIHKENGGISDARNTALKAATGSYLMFVDADDYISLDAVEKLYKRLISDGSNIAIGKHTDVYDDEHAVGTFCEWMSDSVWTAHDVFDQMGKQQRFAVVLWGKMFQYSLFEKIEFPDLICGEDLWVFPLMFEQCKKISVVDHVVYYYYQRFDSTVHLKSDRIIRDDFKANIHMTDYLMKNGYISSARVWYKNSINKAVMLIGKREARRLIKEVFDYQTRRMLMNGQSFNTYMKWISLYVPPFYTAAHMIKNVIRSKENE